MASRSDANAATNNADFGNRPTTMSESWSDEIQHRILISAAYSTPPPRIATDRPAWRASGPGTAVRAGRGDETGQQHRLIEHDRIRGGQRVALIAI